jgi:3-oxoadipate enol-lactonase
VPFLETAPDVRLHYIVDDYTDPWTRPETVLMLHGIGESANAWFAWVPHFARRYRVVRPDLRGFGESTSLEDTKLEGVGVWADDLEKLMAHLKCERVHVVGAKLGALIGMELARRRAPWMASLTIAGLLISPKRVLDPWVDEWCRHIDEHGMEGWARLTMPGRMGNALGPEAYQWWIDEMSRAKGESVKRCLNMVRHVGEAEGLEQFTIPTLVMVASGGDTSKSFEQRQSVEAVDRFRARIPRSRLEVIDAGSYHVAGTHPDACARTVLSFLEEEAA